MRTLVLIVGLTLAARAEDRAALLNRILSTEAGTPVRVRLEDKTTLKGLLARVGNEAIEVRVAQGGSMVVREVPVARIRSFKAPGEDGFLRGFKHGMGGALGVVAGFVLISLLIGAVN